MVVERSVVLGDAVPKKKQFPVFSIREDYGDSQEEGRIGGGKKSQGPFKGQKMMTSSEALEAIRKRVCDLHDAAIARAKANRRSTVKAQDR